MSRKRKHEHVNHERWLVSYADFITLLFAFFVVLYSTSQVDKKKMQQVSAAIQGGFQQMGVFSAGPNSQVKAAAAQGTVAPSLLATPVLNDLVPAGSRPKAAVPLSQIKNELEGALSEEISKHQVEMRLGSDGLIVSLREVGFFNSGEAQLLPGAEKVLMHVAKVLGPAGFQIRVEGHTDDVPINNAQYHSNWELSTARATQVVLMMVKKCGFQAEHISIAGYAQYHPVADNTTEDGRRRNRRIDLVVVAAPPPTEPTAELPQKLP